MPTGQDFIRHEFDEAIAVQQGIVEAEKQLAGVHPLPQVKDRLKTMTRESQTWLEQLQKLGKPFGATGKQEEVSQGMSDLLQKVLQGAQSGDASEVYEAHAVLLNSKRKQQDSAGAMQKIARAMKETELATAAGEMQKACQAGAEELAASLKDLAVMIATDKTGATAA